MTTKVSLEPLTSDDREQFIADNQEAFNHGALEEFGVRDEHFEEEGQIISRETIEASLEAGEAYRIVLGGRVVGGVVVRIDGRRGDLDLMFVSPREHSKGIGQAAWAEVERMYPHVGVWETVTPYFEKRNIHFYVNRLGFHIVEFFNENHVGEWADGDRGPGTPREGVDTPCEDSGDEAMFRFEKVMPAQADHA